MIDVIDFKSARDILGSIDPLEMLDWVKWCFENKCDFQMPAKTRLSQSDGDYYACMPCMHEGLDFAISKMIGRHVERNRNEGLPPMTSDVLCYQASSGKLRALVDGEYVTTVRTGACAAYSALMYSVSNFETVGLIGLGNIMTSFMDVLAPMVVERNLTVKLYRHNGQERRFATRFAGFDNLKFVFCDTYDEVADDSDLIVSAVTKAEGDFCDPRVYKRGCTIIPIMTLGFQGCDTCFDKVFTDEVDQIRGFKFFNEFKSVANTDDVLMKKVPGRENDDERILVYNYGLASLDLVFIYKLLELNRNDGILKVPYRPSTEKYFMG